jgi:hypothetical protein
VTREIHTRCLSENLKEDVGIKSNIKMDLKYIWASFIWLRIVGVLYIVLNLWVL